ncbi:M23 family metallopeptidase, partial [Enterobacter hormaechei]|uniref:M23 family metallopeptidase n=1 Tax=Enterobacter hormaechei TaxID=158836 RepID=UPI00203F8F0D
AQLTGNRVILDHGNDEYSVLAHLRQGSVRVAQGQVVRSGTHLAGCGNSGNSSEPHLHYQLQAGPAFGVGVALPAQFSDYL